MTQDHYKTKILPVVVHLKTADGSSMSSLGKVTLHLCTATFNIYDKLLDTDILFGIDMQREGWFLTYTRNCEQQHNIAVVKSPLKIPQWHHSKHHERTQCKGSSGIFH